MSLYVRIFKPHVYTLADGTAVEEKRSRAPLILLVLIALTVLSVRITGFDLALLVKKGSKFFDILKAMFPPNTAYLGKIWQPLWDTIKMSILGSFVGAVLAVPFAVAAASNIVTNRVVVFSCAPVFESGAHPADAGVRPDRHLHFRSRHHGGHLCHRRFHLCLCGQAAL